MYKYKFLNFLTASDEYSFYEIKGIHLKLCFPTTLFLCCKSPAKVEFLNFQSSFNTDEDFLVAGEDTTVIQFEVSGNNSVHTFDGKNGPQFYYTTTDMVSHEAS